MSLSVEAECEIARRFQLYLDVNDHLRAVDIVPTILWFKRTFRPSADGSTVELGQLVALVFENDKAIEDKITTTMRDGTKIAFRPTGNFENGKCLITFDGKRFGVQLLNKGAPG